MKLLILLTLALNIGLTSDKSPQTYGDKITLKNPVSLAAAIEANSDKEMLIRSKVTKVCKMKGCWMMLEDKNKEYRVTFSDYGTTVPMTLIGKEILVQGKIKQKKLTLKQTKHYVEDEGGDPSKITEPRTEYRVVASGVKVL
ncbi:MAG: hypothetical protein CME62_07215 [Halobacteriovoraceae bacterium]|nr:hypothetical protein [Halobacteriovoraceae bacterium]